MARPTTRELAIGTEVSAPLVIGVLITVALAGEMSVPRTLVQRHSNTPAIASASVSSDGRFVAFESLARLVAMDTNSVSDIYVLNIDSGHLELVSIGVNGTGSKDSSSTPRLSGDGRYVVFDSVIPEPRADGVTVFLRDRQRMTTRALARAWDDSSRIVRGTRPAISTDGQWVAFESSAQDLVKGVDANGSQSDVYIVNTSTGHTGRVSVASDGTQSPAGSSYAPSVSATGRLVAFTSNACLDGGPSDSSARSAVAPCKPRVYVRDLLAGSTRGVSAPTRTRPNGSTYSPALSADGRYVAFVSTATNLTPDDTNERPDIYVFDLNSESIELLSRTPSGKAGNGASSRPAISEAGRFVAFDSTASDLVCTRRCASRDQDHNLVSDVFLLDRNRGRIRRLSQELTGQPWWEPSVGPGLDAAGRLVTFSSRHAGNSGDARADFDLFVVNLPRENEVPGMAALASHSTCVGTRISRTSATALGVDLNWQAHRRSLEALPDLQRGFRQLVESRRCAQASRQSGSKW
jgi:Tol biopolymer transport system component